MDLADIFIIITALMHLWFLILEMFFWTKPLGLKIFKINQSFAIQSAGLAANQGLYNGFLSAGLIWSLLIKDTYQSFEVKTFFLSFIIIAGFYAGITVSKRIIYFQALPALIALSLLMF